MVIENQHGNLFCPENRLDCTKADIEILYSKLPPKDQCIVKDFESHNGDLFFYYKSKDGVEFTIEWHKDSQSFYGAPIELVNQYLSLSQKDNLSNQVNNTPRPEIYALVELFQEKLCQFIDEVGKPPEVLEIAFESGNDVLKIRRDASRMVKVATLPVQEILEDIQPTAEEHVAKTEEEHEEGPPVLIRFNLGLTVAAIKTLGVVLNKTEMAKELGISAVHFGKLVKIQFAANMNPSTIIALKRFLIKNKASLSQLINHNEKAQQSLSEREFDNLIEFLNSDGFLEDDTETEDDNDGIGEPFNPQYAFSALKLMGGLTTNLQLAEEVGINSVSIGIYMSGKSKRIRKSTEQSLKKWLFNNKEKILKALQNELLVSKTLNSEEKTMLEEYLESL